MKDKFSELLDLGLELVKEGGMFGFVTPRYARRMAAASFLAGAVVGGAGVSLLFMRGSGQLGDRLNDRIEEIKQTLIKQFGDKKEEGARAS